MKFSRFKFSVLLNVIILTQPVNIVKRFFSFSSNFYKIDGKFSAPLFCDSLIIISNRIRFVKNIFKLFSNFFFPTDPLPRGCERKARLLSSDSLTILPLFVPYSNCLSVPVLSLFPTCFIFGFCCVSVRLAALCQKCFVVNLI